MLTGLGHGAVGRGNYQDSTVHLGSTGDHVLNIVGVSGAVNVSIVTLVGLILYVSSIDRDTTGTLFGSLIDHVISHELGIALQTKNLGDSSGQSGLTMVNVTNGTDVYVGFVALEFLFSHRKILPLLNFVFKLWFPFPYFVRVGIMLGDQSALVRLVTSFSAMFLGSSM